MTKPKLSFWQIWNLSFGFLGVQIGYSLQNSNTSSIFESLGADVSHLSYFWLAAPLAGMIVQPIVGLFSDGTWTRWGRRIPYILGGSLISALALGLAGLCLLHDQYALMLPMVGIGIAWAGILAMPYAILSRAVEPRRMGVYMGIFNFTITVPQIVIGLTGGAIVKYCFASDAADMLALAGVFMLLAAVSVFLVKEHKAQ